MTRREQMITARAQARVEKFNGFFAVGDEVEYRSHPDAAPVIYVTRTPAEVLSGHTSVVWLHGKSGCVATDACRKVRK